MADTQSVFPDIPSGIDLMLMLQAEELTALLADEKEAHKRASARAGAAERKLSALRSQNNRILEDLQLLAECWGCANLGNKAVCSGCRNNTIFIKDGTHYIWRGDFTLEGPK